jgi:thymidine kinase
LYFCKDFSHKDNKLFPSKMLIEKNIPSRLGWIEVICGSMFSGKTEELIRRLNRAKIARQKVEIFKPEIDTRYDIRQVVSHDAHSIMSTPVQSASQILLFVHDVHVVGIDEAQFFDDGLISVCDRLANDGIRVIVAGLDMDYLGKPFGPVPSLMAIAEYVTKIHAICMKCGDLAHYSHRIINDDQLILLGEKVSYEPLCRKCYLEEKKNK